MHPGEKFRPWVARYILENLVVIGIPITRLLWLGLKISSASTKSPVGATRSGSSTATSASPITIDQEQNMKTLKA